MPKVGLEPTPTCVDRILSPFSLFPSALWHKPLRQAFPLACLNVVSIGFMGEQAMKLQKVQIVRYVRGGESVPKGTPGAERRAEESRKYYLRLRIGGKQIAIPLSADKRLATSMAKELLRNRLRIKVGLSDEFAEHWQRPIGEHVAEYLADLESKGRSKRHRTDTERLLQAVIKQTGCKGLDSLTVAKVDAFLLSLTRQGKSPRTRNSYRQAIVGFTSWCKSKGRLPSNPLASVSVAEGQKRRIRRALTVEDIRILLEATEKRSQERALLYRLAIGTGLRKSEGRHLKVGDLLLHGPSPMLRLPAEHCKNRKEAVLPLALPLAESLRKHCQEKKPEENVIFVPKRINEFFRNDLNACGIPYRTEQGYCDFHSLRKCTATLLALLEFILASLSNYYGILRLN